MVGLPPSQNPTPREMSAGAPPLSVGSQKRQGRIDQGPRSTLCSWLVSCVAWTTTLRRAMPEQPSSSFDGVVDKGCLDAVLCGERLGGHQVVQECHRWGPDKQNQVSTVLSHPTVPSIVLRMTVRALTVAASACQGPSRAVCAAR